MPSNEEIISPNSPDFQQTSHRGPLPQECFETNHLTHSHNGHKISIKYNGTSMEEARNQKFFHGQIAKQPGSMIGIPEIYHAFDWSRGGPYIVMEYIEIENVASD